MNVRTDIAVIGGGIIGLSCAWQLARRGVSVTLFERGEAGCAATAVAAGMLAPLAEARESEHFMQLGVESLLLYDDFLAKLRGESDTDVLLSERGMLRVAFDSVEVANLEEATRWHRGAGLPLEILSGAQARSLEPALDERVMLAVHSPAERSVDPRAVAQALVKACERRGVRIINADVRVENETVVWDSGVCAAGTIVIAAGTWSGIVDERLPLIPIRGQIMTARPPSQPRMTIFSRRGYVVPRAQSLLIGATEEEAGFDCRTTDEGAAQLEASARRILGDLDLGVISVSAGLRPATPDRLPLIGALSQPRVIAATGHFRNGILLAPITASMVEGLIVEHREHSLLKFVSPLRFASTGVSS